MNNCLLNEAIKDSGISVTVLAEKMGISRASLYNKLKGDSSFDQGEIMSLKTILHLEDDKFIEIFFDNRVDNLSTKETV